MAKPYSKREKIKRKKRKPEIRSAIEVLKDFKPPPLRVLDVGIRCGYSTKTLEKSGYDVVGIDNDREFVKYTKKKGLPVTHDDIMKTKLRPHSFDVIYGRHVLEHCAPTKKFFDQCVKLLRPNGFVLFIFPLEEPRKPGNHKVFFPALEDFPQDKRFDKVFFGDSVDMGIIPFSAVTGEALYMGQLK